MVLFPFMTHAFAAAGLRPEIVAAVDELGFEQPTPIQAETIPHILNTNQDLIALAQTGTGKTAAFGLPLLHQIDPEMPGVQALILCPTRELGIQIYGDLAHFAKYIPGVKVLAVYGGTPVPPQARALRGGIQVVAGTPGRVLDLIRRGALDLSAVRFVVLDEADEMLNMGFQEDLESILSETPAEKQTLLFSATMPAPIARMAQQYMHDPKEVSMGTRNAGADKVSHGFYVVHARDRYAALKRVVDMNPDIYGIVFCRTRRETQEVARKLRHDGYQADAIHGDLSQSQRDEVMDRFRHRQLQMLVATDVAARGLDVDDLTHVINYELPDDPEVYVHRSGRTGRAGKEGVSLSLLHTREGRKLRDLERMVGKKFERMRVPTGREICERQVIHLVEKAREVEVDEAEMASFLPQIYSLLEGLSREKLIQQFIAAEFNRFLSYYQEAPDLNVQTKVAADKPGRVSFAPLFINMGYRDEVNPHRLMGLVNDMMPGKRLRIGKIDISRNFTLFEVEEGFAEEVVAAFAGVRVEGRPVEVRPAREMTQGGKPGFVPGKKFSGKKGKKGTVPKHKRKTAKNRW